MAGKAIDGAKLASAMTGGNQSLSTSGYQKLPGGLILQWGNVAASATSITFPVAFPNACFNVRLTLRDSSYGSAIGASALSANALTTSGFTKINGSTYGGTWDWFAIGH